MEAMNIQIKYIILLHWCSRDSEIVGDDITIPAGKSSLKLDADYSL